MMSDWYIEKWTAAWGRNLPLIVSTMDYPIPTAPDGQSWLVTRHLQSGTGKPIIELRLLDTDFNRVAIAQTSPDQEEVVAAAKKIVDEFHKKMDKTE